MSESSNAMNVATHTNDVQRRECTFMDVLPFKSENVKDEYSYDCDCSRELMTYDLLLDDVV